LPAAALLLAGCAAAGWRKPGMTGESYLRDRYTCERAARPYITPLRPLPTDPAGLRRALEDYERGPTRAASEFLAFKQCMKGKGYGLVGEMVE
jgi:hypothetical protein